LPHLNEALLRRNVGAHYYRFWHNFPAGYDKKWAELCICKEELALKNRLNAPRLKVLQTKARKNARVSVVFSQ